MMITTAVWLNRSRAVLTSPACSLIPRVSDSIAVSRVRTSSIFPVIASCAVLYSARGRYILVWSVSAARNSLTPSNRFSLAVSALVTAFSAAARAAVTARPASSSRWLISRSSASIFSPRIRSSTASSRR